MGGTGLKRQILSYAYWLASILLWEVVLHLAAFESLSRALPMLGFTVAAAALACFLTGFPTKAGRIFAACVPIALFMVYAVQVVYYDIFGSFLSVAYVSMGGAAINTFWSIALAAIGRQLWRLLLIAIPVAGYFVLRRKWQLPAVETWRGLGALLLVTVVAAVGTWAVLPQFGPGISDPAALFRNPTATVDRWTEHFGILTASVLDLKRQGSNARGEMTADLNQAVDLEGETEPETPRNILDAIDFEALEAAAGTDSLHSLNQYFSGLTGTAKHEYSGIFEGYNLIVICAEAFSNYLIDPALTPTLYRMSTEGFVFENFYNSFPNLTTNGEYTLCMGLMPDMSRMSFAVSVQNYLPFCLGHLYAGQGVTAHAYHNNVGTFYNRVNTHTNMGYDFKALDFGLDMEPGTPTSDLEMLEKTIDDYLTEEPFHAYYMTYSGHADYNFTDNAMSVQNQDLVADLEGSEGVRAYIACQLELEKAMTYLLDRLEEAGIADRTVVVLTGDHMPYGLSDEDYAALAGDAVESDPFWRYRNSFICWTGGLDEPVVVEDYCCTQDILPTVLDLMGLPYDSRLLTGRDVLAPGTHLAVLSDGSFLTDRVTYDASSGDLTWNGEEDQALADQLMQAVNNQFTVSSTILSTDYYAFVYETLGLAQVEETGPAYASYADIEGKWYADSVELLTLYGALSGGGTGSFEGEHDASRADFVTMIARALGHGSSDTGSAIPFTDVPSDAWYFAPVQLAWESGWLEENAEFRPLEAMTAVDARGFLATVGESCGIENSDAWARTVFDEAMAQQQAAQPDFDPTLLTRGAAACMAAALVEALA